MNNTNNYWNILIVDDDKDIHKITNLVINDIEFAGKRVKTTSAYNYAESIEFLNSNVDYCIVITDVVLEEQKSGLDLIKYIRGELNNHKVRLILRTGQCGKAPEKSVIHDYDINDYKEKTELTATKLYTSIIGAIRSYRDILIIEEGRKGLQHILNATKNILKHESIEELAEGTLQQISSLIAYTPSSFIARQNGGVIANNIKNNTDFKIKHANGIYKEDVGKLLQEVLNEEQLKTINISLEKKENIFADNMYIGFLQNKNDYQEIIFFKTERQLQELDHKMLNLFQANFELAFHNLYLYEDIKNIQYDVIFKLADVIELRSGETAHHVHRVSEQTYLLSQLAGLSTEICELYKLASTMHDVGKIGISDKILFKPGKISEEEFEIIKTHTSIGYHILFGSGKPIFDTAATIALYHHEQWDGGGYINELEGENIPIEARIVAIIDVFDALSHDRCYKQAWNKEQVYNFFVEQKGKQFDPILCQLFLDNIELFYQVKGVYF